MTSHPSDPSDLDPDAHSIPWVRKRDGSVVAFDTAKLASSIFAAFEESGSEDAAFRAQEFTQAVLHFLVDEFAGQTPSTEAMADSVVKVLREIGQGPVAAHYFDYSQRRRELHREVAIHPSTSPELKAAGAHERRWDKSALARRLQQELDIDQTSSRSIAAAVEKRILAIDLPAISETLLQELISIELFDRGLRHLRERRRVLGVSAGQVDRYLKSKQSPHEVPLSIGRNVLSQFALQEVFSRDVAALHQDQLLTIHNVESPCQWAAYSVNLCSLALTSSSAQAFLKLLDRELEFLAQRVAGPIALDSVDSVAALISDDGVAPAEVAGGILQSMARCIKAYGTCFVVNVFGVVPAEIAEFLSEGPLFRIDPSNEQNAFACAVAETLAEATESDPLLRARCRLDFHVTPSEVDAQRADSLAHRLATRDNAALCFGRGRCTVAEGLVRDLARGSAVYQYVGVVLPAILERVNPKTDDETLFHHLNLLCESAVRAGVQKREFLRQQQPESFDSKREPNASLVVVPTGVSELVEQMFGDAPVESETARSFAVQLLEHLAQRLARESKHYQLECRLDGLASISCQGVHDTLAVTTGQAPSPTALLAAGSSLHTAVSGGTTYCPISTAGDAQVSRLIQFAARETEICRLRFIPPVQASQPDLFA